MTTTFPFRLAMVRGFELIQFVSEAGISGARVGFAILRVGTLELLAPVLVTSIVTLSGEVGDSDGKNLSIIPCSTLVISNISIAAVSIFLSIPVMIRSPTIARISPSTLRNIPRSSA